jgi:ethanolamine utilization protein EutJ
VASGLRVMDAVMTLGSDKLAPEALLEKAAGAFRQQRLSASGPFRVGVDLGTATCVLVVVDADGVPVWVDSSPTAAIRDGVVVDFFGARDAVAQLKVDAEEALGIEITRAGTAYPPGVPDADAAACRFVLESAGIEEVVLMDEVSAAQAALGVIDGVVVDVGGGSTGVGIFRNGDLIRVDDRPGGGHHLDLILAGALKIELAEAEELKRTDSRSYRGVLKPGLERIASSVAAMSVGDEDLDIYLAGGAVMVDGAATIIESALGRNVHVYPHSLFITPVGIARTLT